MRGTFRCLLAACWLLACSGGEDAARVGQGQGMPDASAGAAGAAGESGSAGGSGGEHTAPPDAATNGDASSSPDAGEDAAIDSGPSGPRCDHIEACQDIAEPCAAGLIEGCGNGCKHGNFACGDVQGFYGTDSNGTVWSAACVDSDVGRDCSAATEEWSDFCRACANGQR